MILPNVIRFNQKSEQHLRTERLSRLLLSGGAIARLGFSEFRDYANLACLFAVSASRGFYSNESENEVKHANHLWNLALCRDGAKATATSAIDPVRAELRKVYHLHPDIVLSCPLFAFDVVSNQELKRKFFKCNVEYLDAMTITGFRFLHPSIIKSHVKSIRNWSPKIAMSLLLHAKSLNKENNERLHPNSIRSTIKPFEIRNIIEHLNKDFELGNTEDDIFKNGMAREYVEKNITTDNAANMLLACNGKIKTDAFDAVFFSRKFDLAKYDDVRDFSSLLSHKESLSNMEQIQSVLIRGLNNDLDYATHTLKIISGLLNGDPTITNKTATPQQISGVIDVVKSRCDGYIKNYFNLMDFFDTRDYSSEPPEANPEHCKAFMYLLSIISKLDCNEKNQFNEKLMSMRKAQVFSSMSNGVALECKHLLSGATIDIRRNNIVNDILFDSPVNSVSLFDGMMRKLNYLNEDLDVKSKMILHLNALTLYENIPVIGISKYLANFVRNGIEIPRNCGLEYYLSDQYLASDINGAIKKSILNYFSATGSERSRVIESFMCVFGKLSLFTEPYGETGIHSYCTSRNVSLDVIQAEACEGLVRDLLMIPSRLAICLYAVEALNYCFNPSVRWASQVSGLHILLSNTELAGVMSDAPETREIGEVISAILNREFVSSLRQCKGDAELLERAQEKTMDYIQNPGFLTKLSSLEQNSFSMYSLIERLERKWLNTTFAPAPFIDNLHSQSTIHNQRLEGERSASTMLAARY